jgi:hypothetical protein
MVAMDASAGAHFSEQDPAAAEPDYVRYIRVRDGGSTAEARRAVTEVEPAYASGTMVPIKATPSAAAMQDDLAKQTRDAVGALRKLADESPAASAEGIRQQIAQLEAVYRSELWALRMLFEQKREQLTAALRTKADAM